MVFSQKSPTASCYDQYSCGRCFRGTARASLTYMTRVCLIIQIWPIPSCRLPTPPPLSAAHPVPGLTTSIASHDSPPTCVAMCSCSVSSEVLKPLSSLPPTPQVYTGEQHTQQQQQAAAKVVADEHQAAQHHEDLPAHTTTLLMQRRYTRPQEEAKEEAARTKQLSSSCRQ